MYKQISYIEAEQLMSERDIVIVDMRDEDSYKKSILPTLSIFLW